jgi:peptidyl-dipeptidase Dcp
MNSNPLLETWTTRYGLPPFDRIRAEHFAPALDVAMAAQNSELDAIENNAEAPTFANTVVAFDQHGRQMAQVNLCFSNLTAG